MWTLMFNRLDPSPSCGPQHNAGEYIKKKEKIYKIKTKIKQRIQNKISNNRSTQCALAVARHTHKKEGA